MSISRREIGIGAIKTIFHKSDATPEEKRADVNNWAFEEAAELKLGTDEHLVIFAATEGKTSRGEPVTTVGYSIRKANGGILKWLMKRFLK